MKKLKDVNPVISLFLIFAMIGTMIYFFSMDNRVGVVFSAYISLILIDLLDATVAYPDIPIKF